ncbi:unnamed protein product [Bursaphelenchus xylophilus]|uniref:(pine wood nematode) hypothetical protein n=1 Tax=Bursaphelenchus xylophilus TaxID=6326 RepID=A0A1I7RLP0_BURXY|nr:unnamed protein product [Bursaphelenchus xylophilus]CAG9082756.1 unnamed protein product [Bursaphelenchus xylophilus]
MERDQRRHEREIRDLQIPFASKLGMKEGEEKPSKRRSAIKPTEDGMPKMRAINSKWRLIRRNEKVEGEIGGEVL